MNAQEIYEYMVHSLHDGLDPDEYLKYFAKPDFDLPTVAQIEECVNGAPFDPVPDETYDPLSSDSVPENLSHMIRAVMKSGVLYCYSGDFHMWSYFKFVPHQVWVTNVYDGKAGWK